jgi:Na+-transporting methylmalonyl-CoA/oxaloacetate decarboxylase gamma subunit
MLAAIIAIGILLVLSLLAYFVYLMGGIEKEKR